MPVITLLSDLGMQDASVSIVKAAFLSSIADAQLVDISHSVVQYDLQQASYILSSAYRYFPEGTFHVLLVDVFSAETPSLLLAEHEGQFFLVPDNGILPLVFASSPERVWLCQSFSRPYIFRDWTDAVVRSINAIKVAGGQVPFDPGKVKTVPRLLQPKIVPGGVDCNVLYIDRYENVVLDITRRQFEDIVKDRPFRIRMMRTGDITEVSNNYNDVKPGEPLCRFNNAGFLELAFNHAPAASMLGLDSFTAANLRYQTIKIFF